MQKCYQNELEFNAVYSGNNLLKIKDEVYVINLDGYKSIGAHWIALYLNGNNATYFDSFGVEHVRKEIEKIINIINYCNKYLSLRLEGEGTLNTVVSVGPCTEKFYVVSIKHGLTQKCKTPCICRFSTSSLIIRSKNIFYRPSHTLYNTRLIVAIGYAKISSNTSFFPIQATSDLARLDESKPLQNQFKRI